jgi:hypothetical protein
MTTDSGNGIGTGGLLGRKLLNDLNGKRVMIQCLSTLTGEKESSFVLDTASPYDVYANGTFVHLILAEKRVVDALELMVASNVQACMCQTIHASYMQCAGAQFSTSNAKASSAGNKKSTLIGALVACGFVAGLAAYIYVRKRKRDRILIVRNVNENKNLLANDVSNALSIMNPMVHTKGHFDSSLNPIYWNTMDEVVVDDMALPEFPSDTRMHESPSVCNPLYEEMGHDMNDIQSAYDYIESLFMQPDSSNAVLIQCDLILDKIRDNEAYADMYNSIVFMRSLSVCQGQLRAALEHTTTMDKEMRVAFESLQYEFENIRDNIISKTLDEDERTRIFETFSQHATSVMESIQMSEQASSSHLWKFACYSIQTVCNASKKSKVRLHRYNDIKSEETDIVKSIAKLRRVNRASIDMSSSTAARIRAQRRWKIIRHAITLNRLARVDSKPNM